MRLQQKFIEWVAAVIPSEKPIYLGGASAENVTSCWKVSCTEGAVEFESLRNDHEEADDRMLYHINQAVSHERFERVIVASADTDVFVCSLYHFNRWVYCGLQEMWIISGKRGSMTALPIHQLTQEIESTVIDILPAVHTLTGLISLIDLLCSFVSNINECNLSCTIVFSFWA